MVHRQDERVAVCDEDLLDVRPEGARAGLEVLERLAEVAHAERLRAVHVAVRAVVPRAADRRLDDVRVGLGGRSVEDAFVAHVARWLIARRIVVIDLRGQDRERGDVIEP